MFWLKTRARDTRKYESSKARTVRKDLHQKAFYIAMEATSKGDLARASWAYGIMKSLEKDGEVE